MHGNISSVLVYLSKNNLPNILDLVILMQLLDVSVNDLLGRAFTSIRPPKLTERNQAEKKVSFDFEVFDLQSEERDIIVVRRFLSYLILLMSASSSACSSRIVALSASILASSFAYFSDK